MNFLRKKFLAEELNKWSAGGIIGRDQAERIAALYGVNINEPESGVNTILRIVAYLFFGCSLLVLIGANWEEIPRLARLLLILFLSALVNLGGYLQLKKGNLTYAEGLFLLGTLVFGAGIALIAQVYHLGKHMPDGVLLWAIGAFVPALLLRSSLLGGAALLIAILWSQMESFYLGSYEFGGFIGGDRPTGFLFFLACAFWTAFYQSGRTIVFALFIGVFSYVYGFWRFEYFINLLIPEILAYCLFGVAISYALAKLGRTDGAGALYGISAFFGIAALIFSLFSFMIFGKEEFEYPQISDFLAVAKWLFNNSYGALFLSFCAASCAVGVWIRQNTLIFCAVLCFALPFLNFINTEILYSLICVVVGASLIKTGRLSAGLTLIFSVAVVRYFDLVGDYIGASALFLFFALVVLALSKRKKK